MDKTYSIYARATLFLFLLSFATVGLYGTTPPAGATPGRSDSTPREPTFQSKTKTPRHNNIVKVSTPQETIETSIGVAIEALEEIVADTVAVESTGTVEVSSRIEKIQEQIIKRIEPAFGFHEMTLRALGGEAQRFTGQQVEELTASFRGLLVNLYISQLLSMEGDIRVEATDIAKTDIQGRYAQVFTENTLLADGQEKDVSINYRLVQRDSGWQIYDVIVEGNSLIANYRAQFGSFLANNLPEDLIQKMQKQVKKIKVDQGLAPESI